MMPQSVIYVILLFPSYVVLAYFEKKSLEVLNLEY